MLINYYYANFWVHKLWKIRKLSFQVFVEYAYDFKKDQDLVKKPYQVSFVLLSFSDLR